MLVAAATARADGDPASDFLLTQKVFLPYDARISATRSEQLAALVSDAAREGYPIRIALIASPVDLGSVTALWAKPQQYAKFLGAEVSFAYRGRLLIVMPEGLGTYQLGHPSGSQRHALEGVKLEPARTGSPPRRSQQSSVSRQRAESRCTPPGSRRRRSGPAATGSGSA